MVGRFRTIIVNTWGEIGDETDQYGSYEFKLKGEPWCASEEFAVTNRRLLIAILRLMAQFGWKLLSAVGITTSCTDTLYFEKGMPDPDAQLFAMAFQMYSKIRIIDAPFIACCVDDAIQSQWPDGLKETNDYFGSIEYKLRGEPWMYNGVPRDIDSRKLLCQILANVRAKGFKLYASVALGPGQTSFDSLVFRRVGPAWN